MMMKCILRLLLLFSHIAELSSVSSDDLHSENKRTKKYHPLFIHRGTHTDHWDMCFGFPIVWDASNHIKEKCVIIMACPGIACGIEIKSMLPYRQFLNAFQLFGDHKSFAERARHITAIRFYLCCESLHEAHRKAKHALLSIFPLCLIQL
jgi:hypothetical protein